jgi:hypothetical protein
MIYHPRVSNNNISARGDAAGRPSTPAPARYESFSSVRPSTQYPSYNPTNNNPPPANNARPAMQAPGNNPTNNNPPPANSNRPVSQNPTNNQVANNPQPVNNARPSGQNPNANQVPVSSNQSASNHMQETRMNQLKQPHRNAAPVQNQAQNNTLPQPSPVNQVRTTGRPSTVHNPNNGQPVQRAPKPENKPDQPAAEKPKTREADSN